MTLKARIVGGPGKWDFLTSFGNRNPIEFTVRYTSDDSSLNGVIDNLTVLVNLVGHEDESGHSWLIEQAHLLSSSIMQFDGAMVRGWYPTRGTTKGWLEISA